MKPSVSIIIPACNAFGTIEECLESVAAQTFRDYEVIVIDDASRDNTVETVTDWINGRQKENWQVIQNDVNAGPARARNRGISSAQGQWIAFLDADDAWLPEKLDVQMNAAANRPEIEMWCGASVRLGSGENAGVKEAYCESGDFRVKEITSAELAVSNPVVTSTVLVKKNALNEAGLFNEQFKGPEDYDLWIRLSVKNRIAKICKPLCRYREYHGSLSMDADAFLPQALAVIESAYAPGGALHGRFFCGRSRAKAYRYLSAAWTVSDRGDWPGALRHFVKSMCLWPLPFCGVSGHRWMRLKLLTVIGRRFFRDLSTMRTMPAFEINLMLEKTDNNEPFFASITREFYKEAVSRHHAIPFWGKMETGVAICRLSDAGIQPEEKKRHYHAVIEASARRNVRKAERKGCEFERIDFNRHLDDIRDIRMSAQVRQGRLPEDMVTGEVKSCSNPGSLTNIHDYVYFGVFSRDKQSTGVCERKLTAYAGCLIAGELCMIEHILGHASYQKDGVVPMLISGIADYVCDHYPEVRYYAYGAYFGSSITMRRFKRKLGFWPGKVKWLLSSHCMKNCP